ncbi:MAG TPA: hypothetical protein VL285_26660 [Bryobacteraceae bacterium]|nr:hypothetical protein [Bryobacteraceae bacterium]
MKRRLIIGTGAAILLLGGGTAIYFGTRGLPPEAQLARLPSENAPVLSIDFAALRRGGVFEMLSGPVVEEEPEYKTFVEKTAFDYRRDLDHALIAFHSSGVYFLVRGRFDWKRLETYAREQGGGCINGLCRMPGSRPERKISYFPLQPDLLAMAVSPNESAASRMSGPAADSRRITLLPQPVWLSLPASTLQKSEAFPTGTQLFAKAIEGAEGATISLAPRGKAIEAQLEVACRSAQEAAIIAEQFQKVTALLRRLIEKENQKPNPGDLSGVLTAGVFRQENTRVVGSWPIERAFIENLAK